MSLRTFPSWFCGRQGVESEGRLESMKSEGVDILHRTLERPPFTHLSKSSDYVPGIVLSAQKTAITKIDRISCSYAAYILVDTDNEQTNKKI